MLSDHEFSELFFCITYPHADGSLFDLYGFYIPNLCITKMKYKQSFENEPLLNLDDTPWLKNAVAELGYENTFKIVYSKFDDGFGGEIFRVFLLNKAV